MLETVARFLAAHAIAMLMLSVGLRTPRGIVRVTSARRALVARALLIDWLAVPLLALVVLYVTRPPPLSAATLMVLAICPGVPLVLGHARRARGDVRTSLLVLMATVLTAIVMVPLWLAILSRVTWLDISFRLRDAAAVLLPAIIVPFVVGRIIRVVWPRVAEPLAKVAQALFLIGLCIIVAAVLARMMPALRDLGLREFAAAFLIPFGAAAIGYLVGGHLVADRVSLAYASALGNPALALGVAAHTAEAHRVLPLVLAFILVRAVALLPYTLWFKQRDLSSTPVTT